VAGLPICAALWAMPQAVSGQIYVANYGSGTIGEYTTAGATVNASLVSGLNEPEYLDVETVPEPSTLALAGLGGLALLRLRRQRHFRFSLCEEALACTVMNQWRTYR